MLQATNDQARTLARPPTRRGDLDVLRALVVVGLVLFHSAMIFGAGEFPVKAETEHRPAPVFLAFGATWGTPLLFTDEFGSSVERTATPHPLWQMLGAA